MIIAVVIATLAVANLSKKKFWVLTYGLCVSAALFCQWNVWIFIARLLVEHWSTGGEVKGWNHIETSFFFFFWGAGGGG